MNNGAAHSAVAIAVRMQREITSDPTLEPRIHAAA